MRACRGGMFPIKMVRGFLPHTWSRSIFWTHSVASATFSRAESGRDCGGCICVRAGFSLSHGEEGRKGEAAEVAVADGKVGMVCAGEGR